MTPHPTASLRAALLGLAACLATPGLQACATCFGRSDSALAEGMNMGILVLLGVILTVLAAFAGFMVFLARRSALLAAQPSSNRTTPPHAAIS